MQSIGTKRNYACTKSSGDLIMHWDDDAWYAPDWVSLQAKILNKSNVDICGLSEFYFHSAALHKSWMYSYPLQGKAWVGGATRGYTRAFWQNNPFKNMQIGEDNEFVWNTGTRVAIHNHINGFVSMVHSGNSSPKNTENTSWNRVGNDIIANMMGADYAAYRR